MDIHNVEYTGVTDYKDNNMGYPPGTYLLYTPAHQHTDPDGTVWNVALVYIPEGEGVLSPR